MKQTLLTPEENLEQRVLEVNHDGDISYVYDNVESGESVTMSVTGEGVIIDLYLVDHDGHDMHMESIGWEWDDFVEMLKDKRNAIAEGSF